MNLSRLCTNAQKGDKKAENELFTILFERFLPIAGYRIRNRQDAEEVCQIALETILAKYKVIEFDEGFASWAVKVLDFKIRKYFDKRKHPLQDTAEMEGIEQNQAGLVEQPDFKLRDKLLDCLKKIGKRNNRYARIIVMQFHGYKIDEICEKLNTTPNNVYVLLSRSRSLLKHCLETGDTNEPGE